VSWPILKEIFYDHFGKAQPNRAHEMLAACETKGYPRGDGTADRGHLKTVITQNIDSVQSNSRGATPTSVREQDSVFR
jgi:NAD-dependent deacetylase